MSANPDSILDMVKKSLGFEPDYTAFDLDIVLQINSALGSLQQLGVGPVEGLLIQDNTTLWSALTSEPRLLGHVQNFVFLTVRQMFDPSSSRFGIAALKEKIDELTWRINITAESIDPPSIPRKKLDRCTHEECGDFCLFVEAYPYD
jgi:hypothetical protein